jgi:hypothetical protein
LQVAAPAARRLRNRRRGIQPVEARRLICWADRDQAGDKLSDQEKFKPRAAEPLWPPMAAQ